MKFLEYLEYNDMKFLIAVIVRLLLAVIVGSLIGSERARHGREAGMRTHILVSIGATLTSLMSVYVAKELGYGGDVLRIPAQVISGIGFLGAGMIVIKNNSVITGLTTAAGVWTTSVIGIAIGYGFYSASIIATVLFLVTIALFGKVGKKKKNYTYVYVEIDDMYKTNKIANELKEKIPDEFTYRFIPSKSLNKNHIGIDLSFEKNVEIDMSLILKIEGVVFAEAELTTV